MAGRKGNPRCSNGALYRRNRAWLKAQGLPCAICHEPIDYTLRTPHPGSFEVDHIDPCAKGGDLWARSNLQPTHRKCNRAKWDKPMWAVGKKPEAKPKQGPPRTSQRW